MLEEDLNTATREIKAALGDVHLVGLGVDLADIAWAERILERYPNQLKRILHPAALDYCLGKRRPAQYLAARMAAKEAVVKALGTGLAPGMKWLDVELARTRSGKPGVTLHGQVREHAESLGVVRWELSIAHRGEYAVAIAAAIGRPKKRSDGAEDNQAPPISAGG